MIFLAPLAWLFRFIVFLRNRFYDLGLFKSEKATRPVICVGNLSTGGTGKSPWVHKIVSHFQDKQVATGIVSRGYGGDFDGVLEVTNDMDPRTCGDEPLWLSQTTKAPVVVSRKRFLGAEKLIDSGVDLILLDDGFQHRALQRDVDVVLLDASAPRSRYHFLPHGRLREGFSSLRRAQVVIINKCNFAKEEQKQWLEDQVLRWLPKPLLFHADFVFNKWQPLVDELQQSLPKKVAMTCGLGNPKSFQSTLSEQGIEPVRQFIYPDHYYWKPNDIEKMVFHMGQEDCRDLLITEKDATKLVRYQKHFQEMKTQLWVCKMDIKIHEGDEQFFATLNSHFQLDQMLHNT